MRDPVAVDRSQAIDRCGILSADEDAIRGFEIRDGRAFRKEFRIGKDGEGLGRTGSGDLPLSSRKNRFDCVSGADGEGAFFDNNGVTLSASGHLPCRGLDPTQITGLAGPHTLGLGGSVNGQEDHVRVGNRSVDLRREMKVSPSTSTDDLIQAGFIDGQLGEICIIPSINACLVEVDNDDLNLRATVCNHRHGRTANVASTDAADVADHAVKANGTGIHGA